ALVARHEAELDGTPPAALSVLSRHLLGTLDLRTAAERRRAHFQALRDALTDETELVPLSDTLPAGVSPLVFPLRVPEERRDALRAELMPRRAASPMPSPA